MGPKYNKKFDAIIAQALHHSHITESEAHTITVAVSFTYHQIMEHPMQWERFKTEYGMDAIVELLDIMKDVH